VFSDFANSGDLAQAKAYYDDLKNRARAHGRRPDDILVFPSISPFVRATEAEAHARFDALNEAVDIQTAVKYLSRYFSFFDFSQFPLDEPLPDLGDIGNNSFKSTAEYYKKIAREQQLTLRQLALLATAPRKDFVGDPVQVADKLQFFFEERAVDGFILFGAHKDLRAFVELVVPILQERGLFRREYEHATLRGNLGLPYPENRYVQRTAPLAAHG
jgi:alkanesulfonate monooxygenase SsuD/methylene tetrahydromethanopterin reductase-like flavin-dependent oxidoreductase (luciferase family)